MDVGSSGKTPFSVGYYSHIGGRDLNEDSQFHLTFKVDGQIVLVAGVADGMGGYEAGEAASQAAIQACQSFLVTALTSCDKPLGKRLLSEVARRAAVKANKAVLALEKGGRCGTTLTFGIFTTKHAIIGHVGDSRCYLLHDGTARQLTQDHVDEAGALTNRLGRWEEMVPDVEAMPVQKDAVFLFCTDGLHGSLGDSMLSSFMTEASDVTQGCVNLVERARTNAGSSSDNVTVLAIEAGTLPRTQAAPAAANGNGRIKRMARPASIPVSDSIEAQQEAAVARAARQAERKKRKEQRFVWVSFAIILVLLALLVATVALLDPFEFFDAASTAPNAPSSEAVESGWSLVNMAFAVMGTAALGCVVYLILPSKK